jgi:hypothetical protein
MTECLRRRIHAESQVIRGVQRQGEAPARGGGVDGRQRPNLAITRSTLSAGESAVVSRI